MLDTPAIVPSAAQKTAVIRLTIPRAEIQKVMGPAIGEVMGAVAAQGLKPIGPVFSHHFKMDVDMFDFEVGVPVAQALKPVGRVVNSELAARKRVVRTVYRGPYEGLGAAWGEFCAWIKKERLKSAPDLWERYVKGPESGNDPAQWETELNQPLAE